MVLRSCLTQNTVFLHTLSHGTSRVSGFHYLHGRSVLERSSGATEKFGLARASWKVLIYCVFSYWFGVLDWGALSAALGSAIQVDAFGFLALEEEYHGWNEIVRKQRWRMNL